MRKFLLALALLFVASPTLAQNPMCPTRPFGDDTNACASTAFVQNAISALVPPVTIGNIVYSGGTNTNQIYSTGLTTPIIIGPSATASAANSSRGTVWFQQIPIDNTAQDAGFWFTRFGGDAGVTYTYTSVGLRFWSANGTPTTPTSTATGSKIMELRADVTGTNTGAAFGTSNGPITVALFECHQGSIVANAEAGGPGECNLRQGAGGSSVVTITGPATPAVISWATHGLADNQKVMFTSSGALPTGLTAGTIYCVQPSTKLAGSFEVYPTTAGACSGGTSVNSTGAGSGTQTAYAYTTATNLAWWWGEGPRGGSTHYIVSRPGNTTTNPSFAVTYSGGGNVGFDWYLSGSGTSSNARWLDGNGKTLFTIGGAAGTLVNWAATEPSAAGVPPAIAAKGSTADNPMATKGQGTGGFRALNAAGLTLFEVFGTASAATYWAMTPNTTGNAAILEAYGETNTSGIIKPRSSGTGTIEIQNGGGNTVSQWATTAGSRYTIFTADNTNPSITSSAGSLSLNTLLINSSGNVTSGVWNAGAVTSSGAIQAAAASGFALGAVTVLISDGSPSANFMKVRNSGSGPNMAVGNATDQRIINTANAGVQYNSDTGFNVFLTNGTGQYFGSTSTQTRIYATTAATSTTDGALRSSGGLSVSGAGWFGTYVATGVVAVGSLPACGAGIKGARMFVNDSNAASYTAGIGAVVAAGGATNVPVICDGTNWRIGVNDNIPGYLRRNVA